MKDVKLFNKNKIGPTLEKYLRALFKNMHVNNFDKIVNS